MYFTFPSYCIFIQLFKTHLSIAEQSKKMKHRTSNSQNPHKMQRFNIYDFVSYVMNLIMNI